MVYFHFPPWCDSTGLYILRTVLVRLLQYPGSNKNTSGLQSCIGPNIDLLSKPNSSKVSIHSSKFPYYFLTKFKGNNQVTFWYADCPKPWPTRLTNLTKEKMILAPQMQKILFYHPMVPWNKEAYKEDPAYLPKWIRKKHSHINIILDLCFTV